MTICEHDGLVNGSRVTVTDYLRIGITPAPHAKAARTACGGGVEAAAKGEGARMCEVSVLNTLQPGERSRVGVCALVFVINNKHTGFLSAGAKVLQRHKAPGEVGGKGT